MLARLRKAYLDLSRERREMLRAYNKTIEAWARATEFRDQEAEGHSLRCAELTVALAKSMGINGEKLVHMRRGALLHDIGKIAIPDRILLKKGRLTSQQLAEMMQHPVRAKEFIEKVELLGPALDIPYSHHERWDGSGYPQGLKGETIPIAARIFAVVDAWDALTSDRPYRPAVGFNEALKFIESQSGKQFDPDVARAFIKLMGRK
ncbi:MAG: HD-GYP domain-containing protein [Anaerolineales bacterium]